MLPDNECTAPAVVTKGYRGGMADQEDWTLGDVPSMVANPWLADDADEFRVDLGSGGVVEPSRWEGTTMSTMTSVRANGVELGVETFGRDDDPLVLLAGGPTMLSWPDSVCERLPVRLRGVPVACVSASIMCASAVPMPRTRTGRQAGRTRS